MFEVKVSSEFSAAHSLRGYRGKCEQLHGHNWKVEMVVGAEKLDKIGLVVDFKQLRNRLGSVLNKLDHQYLNDLAFFKKFNPTSENIARYIYDNMKRKVSNLKSVTVWESERACASYYEE